MWIGRGCHRLRLLTFGSSCWLPFLSHRCHTFTFLFAMYFLDHLWLNIHTRFYLFDLQFIPISLFLFHLSGLLQNRLNYSVLLLFGTHYSGSDPNVPLLRIFARLASISRTQHGFFKFFKRRLPRFERSLEQRLNKLIYLRLFLNLLDFVCGGLWTLFLNKIDKSVHKLALSFHRFVGFFRTLPLLYDSFNIFLGWGPSAHHLFAFWQRNSSLFNFFCFKPHRWLFEQQRCWFGITDICFVLLLGSAILTRYILGLVANNGRHNHTFAFQINVWLLQLPLLVASIYTRSCSLLAFLSLNSLFVETL